MLGKPRPHHYLFAHRELPSAAFRFGADFVAGIGEGRIGLAKAWELIGESFPEEERLPADELAIELHTLGTHDVVLVSLPPPAGQAEAHFVAIAAADRLRYFTLEAAESPLDGRRYTVLGEWTEDHTHVNFGPGPEPDKALFLTAVGDKL
jgi:hypothetical protein